jgi:hypothetical protein
MATSYGFQCLSCGDNGPHRGIRTGYHVVATCARCRAEHDLHDVSEEHELPHLEMVGLMEDG